MTTLTPAPVSHLRRAVVSVIIVAFALAAIGGIVVLLGAELGETALRVIGTTAVVGAFSVAVLCCAALLGRRLQTIGVVGTVVSVVAAALVVWTVWYQGDDGSVWEVVSKVTGTAATLSAALALASLLLLLADRRRAAVRRGLIVTLGLFAVVTALILVLIWAPDAVDDRVFPRVLGIAGILAALGAVVVPVLSLLMPDNRPGTLSPIAVARLEDEAHRRGLTPDALVDTLLAASAAPPSQEER
ncbi:hypothetical protein ET475_12680 [Microbacterium protaetiae]|uniref:Uncharacterized protein n=1 Tax=Microbacterium protaetiae TaxID=2509458 RepID=A0A4P6EEV9_9MICO|nr:hypothetical protein [Microbacterium protaetiae]QAY60754.1 hypothetical protein ET475_12680 [Microbacterium protaetiae]